MNGRHIRRLWWLAVALVMGGVGINLSTPADAGPEVSIAAAPKWGAAPSATWTPYSVTVRNDGGSDLEGQVVLAAQPEKVVPGARPKATAAPLPTTGVLAMGDRTLPVPVPGVVEGTSPAWPSYRVPVSVPGGTEKTLTVMVMQAPFGFDAELVDGGGRVLATANGPMPGVGGVTVLLLSDIVGAEARLDALPRQVAPLVDVIQLRGPRDFPDEALHLAGLDAVVIDDFDTATLTERQHRAIQEYVSLGGSLVLTSGAAWSRTLAPLPAGVAPLRASGSQAASLGPLADLVAHSTTATTEIATGELTAGRVVLAAPGGPPLVVEADYGTGRVVQLTYDPLAEPIASDPLLQDVAWDQGLRRVTFLWTNKVGLVPELIAEDQLWAAPLQPRPWPSWPLPGVGLIVLYAGVVGPAVFVLSRRSHPRNGWATVVLFAVLTAGATVGVATPHGKASETVVEVRTQGADGTVLTTAYSGVRDVDPSDRLEQPPGAAASVYAGQPLFRPVWDRLDQFLTDGRLAPVNRGLGGGTIRTGGERPEVQHAVRPWELRTIQTMSITDAGPGLDAKLRLVGASAASSPPSPGRVQGTVSNHGLRPVHEVRAQIVEGQASLFDTIAPGESKEVDAPIVRPHRSQRLGMPTHTAEEAAMYAAASRSFTAPGQIAVVGMTSPPTDPHREREKAGRKIGVVVKVVPLESADSIPYGAGGSRLVTEAPEPGGLMVLVVDMSVPAGTGQLSVLHSYRDKAIREVFNWTTGSWRPVRQPPIDPLWPTAEMDTPLDPAEVNNGLVRYRSWNSEDPLNLHLPPPHLTLTSLLTDSEEFLRPLREQAAGPIKEFEAAREAERRRVEDEIRRLDPTFKLPSQGN